MGDHRQPSRRPVAVAAAVALACGIAAGAGGVPAVTAVELRPAPKEASDDRGRVFRDGCLVDQQSRATRRCTYANRRSETRVLLFGDSEAMQFFPPLLRISRSRGWRLMTRLRAGCTPAAIRFSHRCDDWRRRSLRLIERSDHPDLVVVTGGVAYEAVRNRRRLSSKASGRWLRRGYVRTLRRLRRTGAHVAVIRDTPRPPHKIPGCVLRHPERPDRCDFSRRQPTNRAFDKRAARSVRGARLLDPTPVVCPGGTCTAVADDVLVYRDHVHFTATFAATLTPWLREHLPRPRR